MNATRTRISNWRNRRTLARGRRPRLTQAADQVRSRTPLYRDRVNRATGRPHRDDARLGRTSDDSLARMRQGRGPLAARGPETASVIERGYCEHPENGRWPALAVKDAARRARGRRDAR